MNVTILQKQTPVLMAYMADEGYSKGYMRRIRQEIERISEGVEDKGWNSYDDAHRYHLGKNHSKSFLKTKQVILRLIENFDEYGLYPSRQEQKHHTARRGKYHILTDEYKEAVDYYRNVEKLRGIKDSTIYGNSQNAICFLLELQEKGITALGEIDEKAVLSAFISSNGELRRGYGYKKNLVKFFKACLPLNPEAVTRILLFIPELRDSRKNILYLLPDEINRIKQELNDGHSSLSLRDKAMGVLALCTGMRSCDIAGLKHESVDFDNDLIQFKQLKTGVPLELPLTAAIGNAIYDYINQERPDVDCEYIFLTEKRPHRRLKADTMWNISAKIMNAAKVRMTINHGGFRIYRHRLATALLGNGIAPPIISGILGQAAPKSLEIYLSADFQHLKNCALSIEPLPAVGEVSVNA